jgi:transcriptional regulator with XRE-family HTH domain
MRSKELGDLITFHRKKAGLTQIGLAELASVSRSVVQDLEAGKGRTVWEHVVSVLSVLNIELEPSGPLVEQWLKLRKVVNE